MTNRRALFMGGCFCSCLFSPSQLAISSSRTFCLCISLCPVIYTSTAKATSDSHEEYREPIFRKPAPNPKERDIYRAGLKYKVPRIRGGSRRAARPVRTVCPLAHGTCVPIFLRDNRSRPLVFHPLTPPQNVRGRDRIVNQDKHRVSGIARDERNRIVSSNPCENLSLFSLALQPQRSLTAVRENPHDWIFESENNDVHETNA